MDAVRVADLERADHVRVVELRQQSGFALEAAEDVRALRPRRGQDLQGDDLAEAVDGLVNAAHLPLADAVEDLVPAEEEVVGAAALDERGLILGQCPLRDEKPAERFDLIVGAARSRRATVRGALSISSAGSSLLLASRAQ